jgi:uncharacterized membrane protein YfcA
MDIKRLLLALLVLFGAGFIVTWFLSLRRSVRAEGVQDRPAPPTPFQIALGAVTNFFDTLGIGSYAPTTAVFKLKRMVPDERIPGTLTIGHTLPTVAQALIFISIVEVELATMITLIAAAVLGAWLGAGVVARWPRRKVQFGMGFALLAAAGLFIVKNLDEMRGTPVFPGGEAVGLQTTVLIGAAVASFVLGALMTIGVGFYAPCLIMISLLGMNPRAAFPIMMGSCAFLMPVASVKFLQAKKYSPRPALGLAIGGIPAVLVAALIVKSLPLTMLRWLVVVVVLYAAVTMIRSGVREARLPAQAPAAH